LPGIVLHLRMGIKQFRREICKSVIVQGKLALEGTIRDALTLTEECDNPL
jgi:hypothetical protein